MREVSCPCSVLPPPKKKKKKTLGNHIGNLKGNPPSFQQSLHMVEGGAFNCKMLNLTVSIQVSSSKLPSN